MHRLLLFLLCFCPALTLLAQFSQPENFVAGDQARYLTGSLGATDPGKAGKNVVWDFSGLRAEMDTGCQLIRPSGEVYLPPGLEHSQLVECNDDSTYVYLLKTADTLWMTGYREALQGFTILYDRPVPFMVWPLQLGTRLESTANRSYTMGGMAFNGTGTCITEADGTGKLKLPGREYKKTIRVCFRQVFTDTADRYGSATTVTMTSYAWFDNEHKHALFKLDLVKVESVYYHQQTQSFKLLIP